MKNFEVEVGFENEEGRRAMWGRGKGERPIDWKWRGERKLATEGEEGTTRSGERKRSSPYENQKKRERRFSLVRLGSKFQRCSARFGSKIRKAVRFREKSSEKEEVIRFREVVRFKRDGLVRKRGC